MSSVDTQPPVAAPELYARLEALSQENLSLRMRNTWWKLACLLSIAASTCAYIAGNFGDVRRQVSRAVNAFRARSVMWGTIQEVTFTEEHEEHVCPFDTMQWEWRTIPDRYEVWIIGDDGHSKRLWISPERHEQHAHLLEEGCDVRMEYDQKRGEIHRVEARERS